MEMLKNDCATDIARVWRGYCGRIDAGYLRAEMAKFLFAIRQEEAKDEEAGLCFAVDDKDYGDFQNYEIQVEMLNINSNSGPEFGHLGIIFNFVDQSNFDFFYLR